VGLLDLIEWLQTGPEHRVLLDYGPVPVEISALIREVERALEYKLYYLAIAVSLSLPDICACLEFDPNNPQWANKDTYARWADANINFKTVSGEDLYRLRCGVLHFGNFEHKKSVFDRVIFVGPESRIKIHDTVITVNPNTVIGGIPATQLRVAGQILHMDVELFCKAITEAVKAWSVANAKDPCVQQNLPRLIRYRPEGLPPFSVGVPSVA
jgi:hypothetical protein